MKNEKLIDAIGEIADEYINEAHSPRKAKSWLERFRFSNNLKKLVLAGICICLAIVLLPNLPSFSSKKEASDSAFYTNSYDGDIPYSEEKAEYASEPSTSYAGGNLPESTFDTEKNASDKKILTAWMNLQTQDLDALIEVLNSSVSRYNGYFQTATINTRSNDTRYYEAVIRIPASAYGSFLTELKESGNATFYQEEVEDVLEAYTDLESRLESLKAQQKKVLEFYDRAESLDDLMSVEARLSELEYQISSIEARIRNYDLLIAYSTLHLTVNETTVYTPEHPTFLSRLGSAFVSGWSNFTASIGDFLIDLVYNIWTILFFAGVMLLAWFLYRKFRNRKNK